MSEETYREWYESQALKGRDMSTAASPYGQIRRKGVQRVAHTADVADERSGLPSVGSDDAREENEAT